MSTIPTSTSPSSQAGEPPYPSMRDVQGDGLPSLEGDFPSAISVMKTALTPDSLEPLFQPDPSGGSSGTWHEICQLALTEPKVSSVRASEEDSDTEWLVSCCREERPVNKDVKLGVRPAEGCQFVTIRDFVSAVHPWLLSLREDILMAKRVTLGYLSVFATEFIVEVNVGGTIRIMDRENWIKARSGAPQNKYLPATMLERIRKAREVRESARK
ncbi:hypothetical protein BKA61DRAFT_627674 [Leptodontidium sp. MPI-SDFR-AT-0119]|nr:hypothetical protein BKA61DRAFT_627674 [Leptodontidium sp. MPI-SDFR-AT-0119]